MDHAQPVFFFVLFCFFSRIDFSLFSLSEMSQEYHDNLPKNIFGVIAGHGAAFDSNAANAAPTNWRDDRDTFNYRAGLTYAEAIVLKQITSSEVTPKERAELIRDYRYLRALHNNQAVNFDVGYRNFLNQRFTRQTKGQYSEQLAALKQNEIQTAAFSVAPLINNANVSNIQEIFSQFTTQQPQ